MTKIAFDVSGVASDPPSKRSRSRVRPAPSRPNATKPPDAPLGSFAARVEARQVDLVKLVQEGVPELAYLPASDGMLVRGKRHLIAAPHKTGKSIGMQVHWVDIASAGGTVAILDRENGADSYARRLADILDARKLSKRNRGDLRRRLRYYEFPQIRAGDADDLAAHFGEVDLVVFDAQRMFLSDLGLKEADSDDYARFMAEAIDPLFRAGVATCILDNTGHSEQSRSRGSSAKGDLNEVLFSMETLTAFDAFRRGELRLKVQHTRFGNVGAWRMAIGGGTYESWKPLAGPAKRDDFQRAVLDLLEDRSLGQDKLLDAVRARGVRIGTDTARVLLEGYVEDSSVLLSHGPNGYFRIGS